MLDTAGQVRLEWQVMPPHEQLTFLQEEYKCIAQQWVKKKQGFFLVYSIIDDASFVHLKAFHELIREEYIECADEPTTIPPIVLVGNKVDLASERVVSKERAEALAGEWGQESPVRFLEVRYDVLSIKLLPLPSTLTWHAPQRQDKRKY